MRKTMITAIWAALVLSAASAIAAPTAEQQCEAGKKYASGRYLACLGKAEKILVLTGDGYSYGTTLGKCERRLLATWQRLENAALAVGGSCPSTGDAAAVRIFLNGCIAGLGEGVSGGALPPDVAICEADLRTCATDFGACQSNCVASVRPPLRTGQTTSYGTGSDGNTQVGAARSFTDNGDGTITDNTTGLMWEKKDDSGGIHDQDNSYSWSAGMSHMDGTIVTTFLATLNGGAGFAGHTDWRVPNQFELFTLVNMDAVNPSTYSAFNAGCVATCTVLTCSCTRVDLYWSSSTLQGYPGRAVGVGMNYGGTGFSTKTGSWYVRAVRAGS